MFYDSQMNSAPGTLYLVATPIGNLSDISRRALETLQSVDLIACEDTRHTGKLLAHYGISKRLMSYHEHNEAARARELGSLLAEGKNIAVVSDAGTPAVADPSFRVVEKAHEMGARVVPVPGAVAFVSAVVASGLPTDSIFFGGFLPSKKNERRNRLAEVAEIPATLAFYEAPHRLAQSLAVCAEILGDRKAAVARELTKLHEEIIRGGLKELAETFAAKAVKGEIVLVIDRQPANSQQPTANSQSLSKRVAELESEGLDNRAALKRAAKEFGLSRSEAYRLLISERKE
jgi:16S rRNA (cytidine1402-2'-O)-methyltransferase